MWGSADAAAAAVETQQQQQLFRSMTFQMLWPLVATNCGSRKPGIASLWIQKYCDLWPQQIILPELHKWLICLQICHSNNIVLNKQVSDLLN